MNKKERFSGILVDNYELILRAWPHSEDIHRDLARIMGNAFPRKNKLDVFEMGSGRGEATKYILSLDSRTHVDAVDLSEVMCSKLSSELSDYVKSGRLQINQSDAFEYLSSVKKGSYDVSASAWILHNFARKDRKNLLEKIHNSLSRRGLFIMMDKVLDDDPKIERESLKTAIKYYKFLLEEGKKDVYDAIVAHEKKDHKNPYALRKNEFTKDLLDAGFVDIEFRCSYHDPSERDLIVSARKAK